MQCLAKALDVFLGSSHSVVGSTAFPVCLNQAGEVANDPVVCEGSSTLSCTGTVPTCGFGSPACPDFGTPPTPRFPVCAALDGSVV